MGMAFCAVLMISATLHPVGHAMASASGKQRRRSFLIQDDDTHAAQSPILQAPEYKWVDKTMMCERHTKVLAKKPDNVGKGNLEDPWFAGTIQEVRRHCCFVIQYEDGDLLSVFPQAVIFCPDRGPTELVPGRTLPPGCDHSCLPIDATEPMNTTALGP